LLAAEERDKDLEPLGQQLLRDVTAEVERLRARVAELEAAQGEASKPQT
jgi:Erythronolide synthase docking domain